MGTVRSRGKSWQVDYKCPTTGKRMRKSFATRENAEAFLMHYKAGEAGVDFPPHIKAFADQVFDHLWADAKGCKTAASSLRVLFDRFIQPDEYLANFSDIRVDRLVSDMRKHGYTNGTINNRLGALSKLLSYAQRCKLIAKAPRMPYLKHSPPREFVLTKEQERDVAILCDNDEMQLFLARFFFLLYTGCRYMEMCNLVRERDVQNDRATFRETKNGSTRTVPLSSRARWGWNTACRLSSKQKPFSDMKEYDWRKNWLVIKSALRLDSEKDFVPHCLRHTCCTRLVIEGVPLTVVKDWMGHSTIHTTMRYAHLRPENLEVGRAALEKMSL